MLSLCVIIGLYSWKKILGAAPELNTHTPEGYAWRNSVWASTWGRTHVLENLAAISSYCLCSCIIYKWYKLLQFRPVCLSMHVRLWSWPQWHFTVVKFMLRKRKPQRPTFLCQKHLHLYITTPQNTKTDLCVRQKCRTQYVLPACFLFSPNTVGILKPAIVPTVERLRELTWIRPPYHTGEANSAFNNS